MTTANDILKQIKDNDVKFVDLRFTDPKGKMQHVTMDVTCVDDVAVVAAVGEGAANTPGALAQLLAVLSRANVPVLNSSQQSSNAAVVVVVPDDAADRAVQVVHDGLIGSARTSRRGNGKRRDVIGESYRVG